MAETLFRQWFVEETKESVSITEYVDFNPARKLAKGTVAPYLDMAGVLLAPNLSTVIPFWLVSHLALRMANLRL